MVMYWKRRNSVDANTARSWTQRLPRRVVPALLAALLCVTPLAANAYRIPELGSPADAALPPARAQQLGADALRQMRERGLILEDAQIDAYVNEIGSRLAAHAPGLDTRLHFFVTREQTINAFAMPGGYVGINAGLILATHTVDELAGVMAHEIGHVAQRHIARQLQQMTPLNWAMGATLLAGIFASVATGNPGMASAALGLGTAGGYEAMAGFTRSDEMEADHVGLRILADSGFDPEGMVGFFERLQQQNRLYGNGIPSILRTHPLDSVRIAEAQERADRYPPRHNPPDTDYRLMRARVRVLSARKGSVALDYFKRLHRRQPQLAAARYGYALALERAADHNRAIELLAALDRRDPGNRFYQVSLADALIAAGQPRRAQLLLAAAMARTPDDAPLVLAYARALLRAGKTEQARNVLLSSQIPLMDRPAVRKLLAQAAVARGDEAEAYYQRAEYYRLQGHYHTAIKQLQNALRLPGLAADRRARIRARLEQMEEKIRESGE